VVKRLPNGRQRVHAAGYNLGVLMRLLIGARTPRKVASRVLAYLLFVDVQHAATIILVATSLDGLQSPSWRYRRSQLAKTELQQRAPKTGRSAEIKIFPDLQSYCRG
jgi:hypothetical protein